jgi:hypothetical protein
MVSTEPSDPASTVFASAHGRASQVLIPGGESQLENQE